MASNGTKTAAQLIEQYVKLRDKVDTLTKEFEASIFRYKEGMQTIEGLLMDEINKLDGKAISTRFGTAYRSTVLSAKVVDRDAWFDWVFKNKAREVLTAHVSKEGLKDM